MTRRPTTLQCGVLVGLALFFSCPAQADEVLRKRIHQEYKHQSYMLIEDAEGARLFLFSRGDERAKTIVLEAPDEPLHGAFLKTRSSDPRVRERGLTELSGASDPEALSVALALLTDPAVAVRDEARQLILDHPDGADVAAALDLVDEDEED